MVCTMQSLSDNERKEVFGEVLLDELKAIREYVQEIPDMKHRLGNLETKVDKIDSRLIVVEAIVREHETELKSLQSIETTIKGHTVDLQVIKRHLTLQDS